jgi:hypothetical protein
MMVEHKANARAVSRRKAPDRRRYDRAGSGRYRRQLRAGDSLDGFIVTKLDGDARGGAALSIRRMTASRSS